MVQHLRPITFHEHYDKVDKPLAKFSGQVALQQLLDEFDFVNEQPVGSSMYLVHPWPEVLRHPRKTSVKFDQCQLGQRNSNREPVKKPTELIGSGPDLLH